MGSHAEQMMGVTITAGSGWEIALQLPQTNIPDPQTTPFSELAFICDRRISAHENLILSKSFLTLAHTRSSHAVRNPMT